MGTLVSLTIDEASDHALYFRTLLLLGGSIHDVYAFARTCRAAQIWCRQHVGMSTNHELARLALHLTPGGQALGMPATVLCFNDERAQQPLLWIRTLADAELARVMHVIPAKNIRIRYLETWEYDKEGKIKLFHPMTKYDDGTLFVRYYRLFDDILRPRLYTTRPEPWKRDTAQPALEAMRLGHHS